MQLLEGLKSAGNDISVIEILLLVVLVDDSSCKAKILLDDTDKHKYEMKNNIISKQISVNYYNNNKAIENRFK
jgi:hypothetical protein